MADYRNGYMLKRSLEKNGYDWWWHSFLAEDESTGDLVPFFIEYYIVNPGLGCDVPLLTGDGHKKPSYAMIKAGHWCRDKKEIHNFWGVDKFHSDVAKMDVTIGSNQATDRGLSGCVELKENEANALGQMNCDSGSISWNLKAEKVLSYSVGFGASPFFRKLNLFAMFWHVQGMKVRYEGEVISDGKKYIVKPEQSCGYQDKNWGVDFTNPWIWLNCNHFQDDKHNVIENCSLDIGGGKPRVCGIPLGEKVLGGFHYKGKLYEFNFSKIFFQRQEWKCRDDGEKIFWDLVLSNKDNILEVHFSCQKEDMIKIRYENPSGKQNHKNLWNGGTARGTVQLYEKKKGGKSLIVSCLGEWGGCEYGRY